MQNHRFQNQSYNNLFLSIYRSKLKQRNTPPAEESLKLLPKATKPTSEIRSPKNTISDEEITAL